MSAESGLLLSLIQSSYRAPAEFPGRVQSAITRNRSLHSSERRRLTKLVYDAIRWRRKLYGDIEPNQCDEKELQKRLADAQALVENPPFEALEKKSIESLSQTLSFPTWIIQHWIQIFGFRDTVTLALSMNCEASTVLRVNLGKVTREDLRLRLLESGVASLPTKLSPFGLKLQGRRNLSDLDSFRKGSFEIQDESSQLACLALHPEPGTSVLDVCAGAGGKSLTFAMMMQNQGRILAIDSDARKLEKMEPRIKRAGVTIIERKWIPQGEPSPLPDQKGMFSRLFVDAPCSALGTLRRHPWNKWTLQKDKVESLPKMQLDILSRYAPLAAPSGRVLYATCTLRRQENQFVVEEFLKSQKNFEPVDEMRTLRPDRDGTDGFFYSLLRRRD